MSQDDHALMGHGALNLSTLNDSTVDHSAMQHDAGDAMSQHGCCAGDNGDAGCTMNACLSMIATVAYRASSTHAHSIVTLFPAVAVPQPPLFPLLRPPIA
jgi:hypothetical protein